jgi:hypothetical protein
VRFIFYALVQVAALVLFLLMAWQIRRHDLQRVQTPPELFTQVNLGAGTMATAFAISIPMALFTEWAYACWIAVPLIGALANRVMRRRS